MRTISPTAVTRLARNSPLVSLVPSSSLDRKTFSFECTRPPKLNGGPAKKLRSFSEKMPNWKTGMATVCSVRVRLVSDPSRSRPVTSMSYGVARPTRPWNGPFCTVMTVAWALPAPSVGNVMR